MKLPTIKIFVVGLGEKIHSRSLEKISERVRLNGLTVFKNTISNTTLITTAVAIEDTFFIAFKF